MARAEKILMQAVLVLVISVLVLALAPARALSATDAQLLSSCMDSYAKLGCHLSGNCDTNVIEILKLLRNRLGNSADLHDVNVLYLSKADESPIHAYETDYALGAKEWNFHVVLEHKGNIIDPDFVSANKRTPMREYFDKMFPSRHRENDGMVVQSIPATDYVNEYGQLDPAGNQVHEYYYRHSTEAQKRYPPRPLNKADPAASILHANPQPLREKKRKFVMQGQSLLMREGGSMVYINPGQRGVQVKGKANPDLERRFLAEIEEEAKRDPAVRAAWERYQADLSAPRGIRGWFKKTRQGMQ